MPFRLQASFNGRPRRLRLPTAGRGRKDAHDQLSQLVTTGGDVPLLLAVLITCKNDFAPVIDAAGIPLQKPLANVGRQFGRVGGTPAEDRFRVDLVDVLAAGAAAPGER